MRKSIKYRIFTKLALTSSLVGLAIVPTLTHAAQTIYSVEIASIQTGWGEDSFTIIPAAPHVFPAGCSTLDAYISSASQPGYKTHYVAVLMAYSMSRRINIVVADNQCYLGRPVILSIAM